MGSWTTRCGALDRWGWGCPPPERNRRGPIGRPGWRGARTATSGAQATTHEGRKTAVEYLVRDARITDAERSTALLAGAAGAPQADARATLGAADLLRQLVYLPSAGVLVAEGQRPIGGGGGRPARRRRRGGRGGLRLRRCRSPHRVRARAKGRAAHLTRAGPRAGRQDRRARRALEPTDARRRYGNDRRLARGRTSPSSWTSRTSSTRPRRPAGASTTGR